MEYESVNYISRYIYPVIALIDVGIAFRGGWYYWNSIVDGKSRSDKIQKLFIAGIIITVLPDLINRIFKFFV